LRFETFGGKQMSAPRSLGEAARSPEGETVAALFDSLLGAYYHTALLLADAEEADGRDGRAHSKDVSFLSWRKRYIDRAGAGPLRRRIPSPEAGVAIVNHYHRAFYKPGPDLAQYKATVRLRKNRGNYPIVPHRHHRSIHASAAWATYAFLLRRLGKPALPLLDHHLDETLGPELLDIDQTLLKKSQEGTAVEAATLAFAEYLMKLLPPWLSEHKSDVKFHLNKVLVDEYGVTRVHESIEHVQNPEHHDTSDEIALRTDPRLWSTNFQEVFRKSYCIDSPGEVCHRYEDPMPARALGPKAARGERPDANAKFGDSWKGYFFEEIELALGPLAVLGGRNILKVKFDVTRPERPDKVVTGELLKAAVTYQLHEGLSCEVLWFLSPAGPDVDYAGPGQFEASVTRELSKDAPKDGPKDKQVYVTRVKSLAAKNVRFPDTVQFSEELNALSLPMWSLAVAQGLVESLVL
jgi:hypothetical protein